MKIEDIEELHRDLLSINADTSHFEIFALCIGARELTQFLLDNMDKEAWPNFEHCITLRDVLIGLCDE